MPDVRGVNPILVQSHLKGMKYPCSKQDLISKAREQGAPQSELEALQKIPDQQYGGPPEVVKALGQVT